MALQYSWILPICVFLWVNTASGQTPLVYDFPEPDGTVFSSDDVSSLMSRTAGELRLSTMRAVMAEAGVDAYIVPTADAHNSLQIAPADARRAWLTEFLGGAGTAVVTATDALVWTDSRYWIQFDLEANTTIWTLKRQGVDESIQDWLVRNMSSGAVVGVDPTTYTRTAWSNLQVSLAAVNVRLMSISENLVDTARRRLQDGPPERPNNDLLTLSQFFTGRSSSSKTIELIRQTLTVGASALVLTALDDIAWTLNLRGSDIPYNPVFFSYLIIRADLPANNTILFWGNGTYAGIDKIVHAILEGVVIDCKPYDEFFNYLSSYSNELGSERSIWVPADSSQAVYQAIMQGPSAARITVAPISPVALMKVFKNPAELRGFHRAHVRDGVALVRGLFWIHQQVNAGLQVTEIDFSDKLDQLRSEEENYMGPSFPAIVGAGANGAIVHYRPSRTGPQRVIRSDDMLLVDSGAQYMDGTTDITRTRHMGNCTEAQRRAFTRVLKGNIALATTMMPMGTKGHSIDVLARKALWDIGLDYGHGTGHGLGHFLNIHEFPAMINRSPTPNDPGIFPSMVYSNEPGYYEEGEYGIRHEDIVVTIVINNRTRHPLAPGLADDFLGQGVVGFSTITMVPHQTSCLDVKLLNQFEIDYLNKFHDEVWSNIAHILESRNMEAEREWLRQECAHITNNHSAILATTPILAGISVIFLWL